MKKLGYSLVIETTDEPDFFCFFSPEVPGFTGCGKGTIDDCINQAGDALTEWLNHLKDEGLDCPVPNPKKARITIQPSEFAELEEAV